MNAGPSKLVRDMQKSFEAVDDGYTQYRPTIVVRLDGIYGEGIGAAACQVADATKTAAQSAMTRLVAADRVNIREQSDVIAPRELRDEATEKCGDTLGTVRGLVDVIYGSATSAALGLVGTIPQDPNGIHQLALLVLDTYDQRGLPTSAKVAIDPSPSIGKLRTDATTLGQAISTIGKESKEAEEALMKKNEAKEQFVEAFSNYAGLVSHLLTMAGLEDAARRLKPSRRRPGRTEELESDQEITETPATEQQVG